MNMKKAMLSIAMIAAFGAGLVACGGSSTEPKVTTGEAGQVKEASKDSKELAFSNATSKIEWVGRKVTGKHDGGFGTFQGKVWTTADGKSLEKISVTITMSSITSDSEKLTGHLKNDDFFAVDKHPEAKFESTAIAAGGSDGATHTVTGNLTLRGVTKSISFPATVTITGGEVKATASFQFNRRDFGVNYDGMKDDLINDMVDLKLDVQAKG